mgnify:CR=1 FL=1
MENNGNIRGCEWVEGTDWNDNMVCMDNEYFELLQEEYADEMLLYFFETLPKPLQLIVKPFFNKFYK